MGDVASLTHNNACENILRMAQRATGREDIQLTAASKTACGETIVRMRLPNTITEAVLSGLRKTIPIASVRAVTSMLDGQTELCVDVPSLDNAMEQSKLEARPAWIRRLCTASTLTLCVALCAWVLSSEPAAHCMDTVRVVIDETCAQANASFCSEDAVRGNLTALHATAHRVHCGVCSLVPKWLPSRE